MRTSELKQPRTISWMTCWQSYRPTRSPNHHIGCESFHSFFTVSRARLGLWMFAAGVWKIRYPCLDFPTRTSCATIRFIADQMSWGGVRHHFMWCVEVENSKIRWLSKWNTTWSFSTSWLSASTLHWHPCCLGGTNIACSSMEIFSSTISSWINFFSVDSRFFVQNRIHSALQFIGATRLAKRKATSWSHRLMRFLWRHASKTKVRQSYVDWYYIRH